MERINSWAGSLWAVDPGETCGWAHWRDDQYMGSGEMSWRQWVYQVDQNRVNGGLYVVESFRVLPWMTRGLAMSDLIPVQVIGIMRYLVGDHYMVLQSPSLRKWFKGKDWAEYGVPEVPASRHARDAVMHGLYWFYFGKRGNGDGAKAKTRPTWEGNSWGEERRGGERSG